MVLHEGAQAWFSLSLGPPEKYKSGSPFFVLPSMFALYLGLQLI